MQDMTEGSPSKHIIRFLIPTLLGLLFQQFYNVADSAIVGRFLGAKHLAAIGSTSSVIFLTIGLVSGLAAGFSIPVSQSFGAGDYGKMRRYISVSVILSFIISLVLTIASSLATRPIVEFLKTPSEISGLSSTYLLIIFLSIPATVFYNLFSGFLRAIGDGKRPFLFLLISSLLNIVLDTVFITVFKLGVMGAGLATLLSQVFSGLISLIYIVSSVPMLRIKREDFVFDRKICSRLLIMGLPMGLQYSVTGIGSSILQLSINSLGTEMVASQAAGLKIMHVESIVYDALGSTMATYCAQNKGAGKISRLKDGILNALFLGFIYAIMCIILTFLVKDFIGEIFLDPKEKNIILMTGEYTFIQTVFFFPLALVNILRFSIQGMGYSLLSVTAGVMELFGRGLAGMYIVPLYGKTGVYLAAPLAWLLADSFLIPATVIIIKRLSKKASEESCT